MISSVPFDSLSFIDELKKGGFDNEKAEAIARANTQAFKQMIMIEDICTKMDLYKCKAELQMFIIKTVTTSIMILGGLQTLFHVMG